MATTLLAAATGAGQSSNISVSNGESVTLILYAASGLTASEYADVQISHDGGTTFQDLYDEGAQVRLHSTNVAKTISGPGIFRVDKDSSTNAAGVYSSQTGGL